MSKWKSNIKRRAVDLFIKNIKNVFENFGKYSQLVKDNFNNKLEEEHNFDFYALINLFKETKEVFDLLELTDMFDNLFYEKYYEYLANGLIKNIDSKNLFDKMIEFYCFFSTFAKFKDKLFNGALNDIMLLKVDPDFVKKLEVNSSEKNKLFRTL